MSAAFRLHFSIPERRALLRGQARASSGRTIQRITALLLLDAGVPAGTLAQTLGVSRQSLTNWKKRWIAHRLAGLEEAPRSGRPARATARVIARLVRTAQRDPRKAGYAFTRWTAPRLAEYLWRKLHVRLSPPWINELLALQGLRWRRTKRTIRNLPDPAELKRARLALKRLKKGLLRELRTMSFGLATASDSTSCPWSLIPTESGESPSGFPPPGRTSR